MFLLKPVASGKTAAVILKDMDLKAGDLFKKPRGRIPDAQCPQVAGNVVRDFAVKRLKGRLYIPLFHEFQDIFVEIIGVFRYLFTVRHTQDTRVVLYE